MCLYSWDYTTNHNENEDENERYNRYNKNRPRSRHGHKYSKYKKFLCIMMLVCIKQQLCKIWSSIHEKVKQHKDWIEKKPCL